MTTSLGVMTIQINVGCDHRPKLLELVGCNIFINQVGPKTWQVYGHHYRASPSPVTFINNRTRFTLM